MRPLASRKAAAVVAWPTRSSVAERNDMVACGWQFEATPSRMQAQIP